MSLLGGRTWAWHQLVGCLAGTGTVAVVGLVGRRAAGPRAGLIAAGLAAGYPLLVAADGSLRSESVYALCIALVLLAALRYRDAPSAPGAALLGVAVAAAALTRGEALALLVLLALPLCGWRRAGVAALACVVVLAPWLARCWIVFDRPVVISTNVGGLLAGANCDTTYHGALIGQWDFGCIPPPVHANEALEAERLRDRGLSYARDHAGRVPVVEAARLGRSFELYRPARAGAPGGVLRGAQPARRAGGRRVLLRARAACRLRRGRAAPARRAVGGAAGPGRARDPRDPHLLRLHAPRVAAEPAIVVLAAVALDALAARRWGAAVISYGFTRLRVAAEPAVVVRAVALDALAARRWTAA